MKLLTLVFIPLCLAAADRQPVVPEGAAKPIGPYTPGLLTSKFLYVSGQGMTDGEGKAPEYWEHQVRQCMQNVKAIVEAAGLEMRNIVATQVYVSDLRRWPLAQPEYAQFFKTDPPAMTLLEVNKMPGGTLVEINAIAVRDASDRRVIEVPDMKPDGPYSQAVLAGGRLFISAQTGSSMRDAERKLNEILKAANMKRNDVVLATHYSSDSSGANVVPVQSLPQDAKVALAAIAVPGGGARKDDCIAADGALFCTIQANPASDVELSVRAGMDRLNSRLKAHGFGPERVVMSNVFLDNLDHFKAMNGIYGGVFSSNPPTRTTVQPLVPGSNTPFRLAVIAE
jgi:2-iminobutanoate/2-iminopropanoate deaminase